MPAELRRGESRIAKLKGAEAGLEEEARQQAAAAHQSEKGRLPAPESRRLTSIWADRFGDSPEYSSGVVRRSVSVGGGCTHSAAPFASSPTAGPDLVAGPGVNPGGERGHCQTPPTCH